MDDPKIDAGLLWHLRANDATLLNDRFGCLVDVDGPLNDEQAEKLRQYGVTVIGWDRWQGQTTFRGLLSRPDIDALRQISWVERIMSSAPSYQIDPILLGANLFQKLASSDFSTEG